MRAKSLTMAALATAIFCSCSGPKWHSQEADGYRLITQDGGPTLGYTTAPILEADHYAFKDLNRNGVIDPYEDWRKPALERAKDLAARLSIEEIAGLMLYSSHQAVPGSAYGFGKATYADENHAAWDLTDQQKQFLSEDNLRAVLVTTVESPEVAARWNNNVQAFVEALGQGIPANNSSDPRNETAATAEFNMGAGGQISLWPTTLGLAATFDPALVRQFGTIASQEYRALGMSDGKDGLHAVFIGNNWKLGAGTYSPDASVSKAGTYLTTGTYFYVGGKKYTPTSGTVIVTNDGADGYTFSAMLFSKDFDGAASVSFSGTIAYEKEYKSYTTCITASKQGENAVQLVLGTDGMAGSFDMSKFQWVYTGTGDVMTLVLYSPDGKLHAGTYTPCPAEGEVAEGTFKHGFLNTQYAQYGVTFADGSFTSSYNNGTKGADTYITDGSIEVSVDGTSYTITVDGTATSARYKGNLPL
jgi:hypothetical protein